MWRRYILRLFCRFEGEFIGRNATIYYSASEKTAGTYIAHFKRNDDAPLEYCYPSGNLTVPSAARFILVTGLPSTAMRFVPDDDSHRVMAGEDEDVNDVLLVPPGHASWTASVQLQRPRTMCTGLAHPRHYWLSRIEHMAELMNECSHPVRRCSVV